MDRESLLHSLTADDLKAILKCEGEGTSASEDELRSKVQKMAENISWKQLLTCVPKESLQRICGDQGMRCNLMKDDLIDQIVRSLPKRTTRGGMLRDLFSPWIRWSGPGGRGGK
jgi:hypothetical protein